MQLPTKGGLLDRKSERRQAQKECASLGIKTPSIDRPVQLLSGGNQQKVMLARWLEVPTRVLFLDEPGRGIDMGAKADIFELIGEMASNGKAVIMISSYLPELMNMCDRIVVMRDGCIAGELTRESFSEERIVELAAQEVSA
jgi:ABC-type sugar transport system ATPase subunit